MINSDYTVRVIQAEQGYKLTQSGEVDIKDRFVATKIFLSKTDDPSNYKEITEAEGIEIEKQKEALLEAERKALEESKEKE